MAPGTPIKSHQGAQALLNPDPAIVPRRRLRGRVVATYSVPFGDRNSGFVTTAMDALSLTFEGIPGDRHSGWTRRAGGREPWYPRGAEMRNERQISLLAPDELLQIAERLGVAEVRPEWIGGNLLIDGVSCFSMLPSGTRLSFEGEAVIVIGAREPSMPFLGRLDRAPLSRQAGNRTRILQSCRRLRGLVGWAERPGVIRPGGAVAVQIPEQWIYL